MKNPPLVKLNTAVKHEGDSVSLLRRGPEDLWRYMHPNMKPYVVLFPSRRDVQPVNSGEAMLMNSESRWLKVDEFLA